MTVRLVVVGAGGFGRETLDVVEAINAGSPTFELLGVVDDAPSDTNLQRLEVRGIRHLGSVDGWLEHGDEAVYAIAVGSPQARKTLSAVFDAARRRPATLVHPSAVIGSAGTIGAGTIICAGVQVSTNVRLGRHVHLNPSATVGHDAMLQDYVSVNPAATISGECVIGAGSLIGAASVILQGFAVGDDAVIGAAACVVRDVPSATTVKGVPAR